MDKEVEELKNSNKKLQIDFDMSFQRVRQLEMLLAEGSNIRQTGLTNMLTDGRPSNL